MDPFVGEIRMVGFNFPPQDWASCNGQTLPANQNQALFALLGTYFGGDNSNFKLPDLQGRVPLGAGRRITDGVIYNMGVSNGTASFDASKLPVPLHTHAATFTGTASSANANLPLSGTVSLQNGGVTVDLGTNANSAFANPAAGQTSYLSAVTVKNGLAPANITGLFTAAAPDPNNKAKLGGVNFTAGTATLSGNATGNVAITPSGTIAVTPAGNNPPIPVPVSVMQPFQAVNFIIALTGIFPMRQ